MDFSYRTKVAAISNIRMYIRHVHPHVHCGDSMKNNLDLISSLVLNCAVFFMMAVLL